MHPFHLKKKHLLHNLLAASIIGVTSMATHAGDWTIGSGIYDITGPAADRGMVGYGDVGQTTKGIYTRLWSRAFLVGEPGSSDFVVFVSADLQSITQGVHQGVLKKVAADAALSPYLNQSNLMLSATHTHVGPGGYDHNVMLNMSALGYDEDNYNTIVDGIYQSIKSAFNSKSEGSIKIAQGTLADASINRNPFVYNQNTDKDDYSTNVNQTMTVLKLVKDSGQEIGMINWFAVHNVSSSQSYRLVSGDNKGVASQMFEKLKGANPPLDQTFVAAFANSEEGDVSPNVCGAENGCAGGDEDNTELSASKQFDKAVSLYDSATSSLTGVLDHRFQYVTLPGYQVGNGFTGNGTQTLCEGTIGFSMTAGSTHDGPSGQSGVFEGMTQDNEGSAWDRGTLVGSVGGVFEFITSFGSLLGINDGAVGSHAHEACQYPKPTFLATELGDNVQLYTDTLPFQLFQIGELTIVGVPAEMTTMSGRRLKADLENILSARGINKVIIAGLANAYGGYVTTPEEYAMQYYEGGHTIFGPNSLAAYRQIFSNLATAMVNDQSVGTGPSPKDWSNKQIIDAIGVVYDDKRLWESFGQTWSDANGGYVQGDTVTVKFRSGHPQNNFKTMDSFLEVQRKVNNSWQTVLTDNDTSTRFNWIRDTAADCLACSYAEIKWTIGNDMPTGTYRIRHKGNWKNGWDGSISGYTGTSREFTVYTSQGSSNVAFYGAHGKYLRAVSNGGGDVKNDRTSAGSHETFQVLDLDEDGCIQNGDKIAIRTDTGYFFQGTSISTEWSWSQWKNVETGGNLEADSTNLGSWEQFTLVNHSRSGCWSNNDTISLKSTHGRYAVAESNGDANANRSSIGSWEKFKVKL